MTKFRDIVMALDVFDFIFAFIFVALFIQEGNIAALIMALYLGNRASRPPRQD